MARTGGPVRVNNGYYDSPGYTEALGRMYWTMRERFIWCSDADQAQDNFDAMIHCVSLKYPDLDAVRNQRWPGERSPVLQRIGKLSALPFIVAALIAPFLIAILLTVL